MALAYGARALGTVFTIEYIFSSLLFAGTDEMSFSDAAAHITFINSSWIEIGKWVRSMPSNRDRRVYKRAIIAISLRFFVFAINIAIL